jgi:LPS-assembly protein
MSPVTVIQYLAKEHLCPFARHLAERPAKLRLLFSTSAILPVLLFNSAAYARQADTAPNVEDAIGKQAASRDDQQGVTPPVDDSEIDAMIRKNVLNGRQIDFSAETIVYDDPSQTVTANGDVILRSGEQLIRAEQIIWNRATGEIRAIGKVRIIAEDGSVVYGDDIELTEEIRDAAIENILLVLAEGGRIVANRGTRADDVITLNEATYAPCLPDDDVCAESPSWQIRAVRVVYDPEKKKVYYDGARLELFGLPLIPLPGLNHPVDIKSRSGLLVPNLRFSAANGAEYSQPYYLALAPNRDLTTTLSVFSEVLPLINTRYRALTDDGAYQLSGYATASSLIPLGQTAPASDTVQFRGYFDANGRFQLDENWQLTGSIRVATDRTFLRRYDISRDDRLRSTLQAERIDDDSYFAATAWGTQTLRVNDPQGQVPIALPIIDYRKRLNNKVLGGQTEFQFNTLAISRFDGQDTQRAFASARWDRSQVTPGGQLLTLTAYGRGDLYNSRQNGQTSTLIYQGLPGFQARAVGSLAADVQWPFIGKAFGGTQTFTPRFQVVGTSPTSNLDIPNEDSRAIELEDNNIFALNRLPGIDRVEDGVRVVYGAEWQLRRPGWQIDTVIGQSFRFNDKSDILPSGTGLGQKTSDVVGRAQIRFRDFVQYTHRFRLDKDTLRVRRNEIDATIGSRRTYGQIGYLRLDRDIGPEIEDLQDREEFRIAGRVQVNRYWSVFGSGNFDLTDAEEDPNNLSDGFEPIRTRLGIAYDDPYISLGLTWRRDFIATGDAQRGNTFLFRFSLRNLGL